MQSTFLLGLGWLAGLLCRSLSSEWGWILPLIGGLVGGVWSRRHLPLAKTWLVAGLVGVVAFVYLGIRIPQPAPNDVSLLAPQPATITAKLTDELKQTRSGRLQTWVEAQRIQTKKDTQSVTGRLYVTMAPKQAGSEDIHPSQVLQLEGFLYRPSPPQNPGVFDFQGYLRQKSTFAGLSVNRPVEILQPGQPWGGWALRRRIVDALIQPLGERHGSLLASLVIGSKAAGLDFDLQDAFKELGLAHALAASGFQVTLLIGVMLGLTQRLPLRIRQATTLACLGLYIILTGFSASILRAAVMGIVAILVITEGETSRIRLQPLGTLLIAAVLLTIWDPNLITDLGFQLSFVATLGLMVSADPIIKWLHWMPPLLAEALSVPLAALIWTLPLQLMAFGRVPNYALVANLVTLPLVGSLSILGFAVCTVAMLVPPLGSVLSIPLKYPVAALDNWVTWMAAWPFTSYYPKIASWGQCALLYAALCALTFWPLWQRRIRWQGTAAVMALIFYLPQLIPGDPVQIMALAPERTDPTPILVIRAGSETWLINSGSDATASQLLVPLLRREGIQQIDQAIALSTDSQTNGGWEKLIEKIPIKQFWAGSADTSGAYAEALAGVRAQGAAIQTPQLNQRLITSDRVELTAVHTDPLVLSLTIKQPKPSRWLLLGTADINAQATLLNAQSTADWLWWDGRALIPSFLTQLNIQNGIAAGSSPELRRLDWSTGSGQLLRTEQTGAIFWSASGIRSTQSEN